MLHVSTTTSISSPCSTHYSITTPHVTTITPTTALRLTATRSSCIRRYYCSLISLAATTTPACRLCTVQADANNGTRPGRTAPRRRAPIPRGAGRARGSFGGVTKQHRKLWIAGRQAHGEQVVCTGLAQVRCSRSNGVVLQFPVSNSSRLRHGEDQYDLNQTHQDRRRFEAHGWRRREEVARHV